MAQNTPSDLQTRLEELKKQKDLLDAEKLRLESEKAKIEAEKALLSAKQTDDPDVTATQKQASAAKAQKDVLDAQKSLLDAQRALEKAQEPVDKRLDDLRNQKALADAKRDLATSETDALKAQLFGTVTAGNFTGSVDMKEKVGIAEANLLASQAIRTAGARIAARVRASISADPSSVIPKEDHSANPATPADTPPGSVHPLFLFSVKDFPNFQRLISFRFRKELVRQAFQSAGITIETEALEEVAAPAVISAGLDAFSKILGFFKSDFTVGGIEVKADDSQLLFAVAGYLRAGFDLHVPTVYSPAAQTAAVSRLAEELTALVFLRAKAESEARTTSSEIDKLEKGNDEEKKRATMLKAQLEQLKGVLALHDSFVSSLAIPDSNGNLPIAALAQEFAIDDSLQKSMALLVKLENAAGGYFVKKNLLTGLGAMPLYHMGGSTASYILLAGNNGQVLDSGVVPIHGGFVKAGRVAGELSKEPK